MPSAWGVVVTCHPWRSAIAGGFLQERYPVQSDVSHFLARLRSQCGRHSALQ